MFFDERKLFCFGFGYSAQALAKRLKAEGGWTIAGTVRSEASKAALEAEGYEIHLFDRDHPLEEPDDLFVGVTHVLSSVPPDGDEGSGDPVVDCHGTNLVRAASLDWVGYLSTTGVYGDTRGEEVDETAPLNPSSPRSARRVRAEEAWMDLKRQRNVPVHVFRLPGIYGPGRSVFDQIREGRAKRIDKPGHLFSRIHVDDIAKGLHLSMNKPDAGHVFNLTDDQPAPPAYVTFHACQMIGMPAPPLIPFETARADMTPMGLSFWSDNRRVSNEKIKRVLGFELDYPTFKEGLEAVLRSERGG
ncbi:MAG: SDR family oxidoreductase [Magnetovibrionaceae bacterium]